MVHGGSRDPTEDLARADPSEPFRESLAHKAPPVGVHGQLRRRMCDDGRGPLDGVDLRHQRCVDQASVIVELLIRPLWIAPAPTDHRWHCARARKAYVAGPIRPRSSRPLRSDRRCPRDPRGGAHRYRSATCRPRSLVSLSRIPGCSHRSANRPTNGCRRLMNVGGRS